MFPLFICTIEDLVKRSDCELLYMEYRQHMFGVARSILKDDALSEDVVQDVFIKLIEKDKLPSLDDPRTKAYLTVAAEHTSAPTAADTTSMLFRVMLVSFMFDNVQDAIRAATARKPCGTPF